MEFEETVILPTFPKFPGYLCFFYSRRKGIWNKELGVVAGRFLAHT